MKKSELLTILRGANVKMFRLKDIIADHYTNGGKGTGRFDTEEVEGEFHQLITEVNGMLKTIRDEI